MKKAVAILDKINVIVLTLTTVYLLCHFLYNLDFGKIFTAVIGIIHIIMLTYILSERFIRLIIKAISNRKSK